MAKTNRAKLTKGYVERLKPGATHDHHWDTEVKGFGVRITPSGIISFIVQGRITSTNKEKRITIGRFGVFTVEQARNEAKELLRTMRLGDDPTDLKRKEQTAKITLRQVADAYFKRGHLKNRTAEDMSRHVDRHLAKFRDRPIASLTPAECRKRFEELCAKGIGGGPAPGQAASAMVTLRTLINFAIDEFRDGEGNPIILYNPVSILKRDLKQGPPRTRHIDKDRVGLFWHLLNEARKNPKNQDSLAGIHLTQFLLLTGARKMEGATLLWEQVVIDEENPSRCSWHIPDPKNKHPITLPLSLQAVDILKSRKAINPDSPFVFPSRSKSGHVMDTRAPLESHCKLIGMEALSAHDLRRTFVTLGVKACKLDLATLELLTNHVPQSVTSRHYLETSDLRDMYDEVQTIANYIEQEGKIAAAKASGANVVALRA